MRKITPAGHRALGCLVCECASAAARGGRGAARRRGTCARVFVLCGGAGRLSARAPWLSPRGPAERGGTSSGRASRGEEAARSKYWGEKLSHNVPAAVLGAAGERKGPRTYGSCAAQTSERRGGQLLVASPLSLPPSLLTYLLPYQGFFVPGIGLLQRLCAWISPPQIDTLGESSGTKDGRAHAPWS